MTKVVVGGVDATQDALAAMKAGDLDVTVFQNAAGQGKGAVDAALALAKGEQGREQGVRAVRAGHPGQHGQVRDQELTAQRPPGGASVAPGARPAGSAGRKRHDEPDDIAAVRRSAARSATPTICWRSRVSARSSPAWWRWTMSASASSAAPSMR